MLVTPTTMSWSHNFLIDIQGGGAKTPLHSTLTKASNTINDQTDFSSNKVLTIEPGNDQDPISWFHCSFDAIHSFSLELNQLASLLSGAKQSFVDDVSNQLKSVVPNHNFNSLVNHCGDKQIEWNQMVDLQHLIDAVLFTHLNDPHRWTRLRQTAEQFDAFARHSVLTATTTTLCINKSSTHPINTSSDFDLRISTM